MPPAIVVCSLSVVVGRTRLRDDLEGGRRLVDLVDHRLELGRLFLAGPGRQPDLYLVLSPGAPVKERAHRRGANSGGRRSPQDRPAVHAAAV